MVHHWFTFLAAGALTASLTSMSFAKSTLIDMDNARTGGFGGPAFKTSQIDGEQTFELGGIGGATFTTEKHSIMIGGGGFGLVNELEWSTDEKLEMGYGGLIFGYTYSPESLIHVDSQLLLGAGGVSVVNTATSSDSDVGSFLLAELTALLEVNVTEFLEVGIGGSYRMLSDPNVVGLSASDLSTPSFVISFQFGTL